MDNSVYSELVVNIVKEQESIIGPIALQQANTVPNLHIDPDTWDVQLSGNSPEIIDELVAQYREFFGQAAVEVCRDAVKHMGQKITPEQIPSSLRTGS